ncbi:ATP-grasp domain-containing protein [Nocardia crassostreae]|uniref:ATP-grasp domain-containing protein n=1 Tax=Nocardia crassostreae TaxID=53428 RepID=UPI0008350905|nr:ATP-grasp domain-containing protein [Nocardia crassostreae]
MKPTLLLVGGARELRFSVDQAEAALAQAAARGIRTLVTSPVLAATPSIVAAADETAAMGFTDPEATAHWARRRVAAGEPITAVLALLEMAQVTAADTAAAIGVPGNPPEAIRRIRTKDACRAALAAAGFAQPAVRLCASAADAAEFLREHPGPCIVKPRDDMGSTGVSWISSAADLPAAMALLPGPGAFLVEEFVSGPEFSVEGIFQGGRPVVLAITAKETVPPPYFVEIAHTMPADLPETRYREIRETVSAALLTVGLRVGAFHVEVWLTPSGVVLGEVHARFGGDRIHTMLEYTIPGIELFGLIIDDMLGRPPASGPLEPTRGAAVRYLTPPPGTVVAIEGWEEIRAHPAVLHAELMIEPGAAIRPLRNSLDRVAMIVFGAETSARARELAAELAASVRFVTVADSARTTGAPAG